jgi:LAS superfamily LD-carboxypeptidase LdcB
MSTERIHTLFFFVAIIVSVYACQHARSEQQVSYKVPDTAALVNDIIATAPIEDTITIPMDLQYIMGRYDPAKHPDFILIEPQYAEKAGMYLRKDTYRAFMAMYQAAMKDGIKLQIKSATRNFYAQKGIWEAKWTGARLLEGGENLSVTTPDPKERALKILRYSSMPGSSRHHWGTDIDLNNLENDYFASGEGLKMYNWLKEHGAEYGFCQPYSAGRPYGYFEERWHWSYTPVSAKLTTYARTNLKNEMIDGFLGSESAPMIDVVKHYVLGINETCNTP